MDKRLVIVVFALAILLGCDRKGVPQATEEKAPAKEKGGSSLSALPTSEPVPDLGHRLTEEQQRDFHFLPRWMVTGFKHQMKRELGIQIPASAGSFVSHGIGDYKQSAEMMLEYSDLSASDDFANSALAFMVPVDEIYAFLEHLKERGEALNNEMVPEDSERLSALFKNSNPPFVFSEGKGRGADAPELLSYQSSGKSGCSMGFGFLNSDGEAQTIGFIIDMDKGIVWYRGLVWDD